ncbi:unnamed protein product [Rotaria sp. Silwood2]|nr:unnamed protein product [Rotaria sp. Silwood2]CAF4344377.1 unnamed protein product [Rotaria sp. Silwood2]
MVLNSFDVECYEKAISNADGTAIFYDPETEHVYSVTVNKNLWDKDVKVIETKIDTVTLDTFIKQNNLPKIDLIKIDVESHEPEVLQGFSEYIKQFRPTMLVEILDEEVGKEITKLVDGLGYLYYNINEYGKIYQEKELKKSDDYNYLICDRAIATKLGLKQETF